MVFEGRFDAEVCLGFIRGLVRNSTGKVILIIDRHPVHISAAAACWLEKPEERISMFFLPGWSAIFTSGVEY